METQKSFCYFHDHIPISPLYPVCTKNSSPPSSHRELKRLKGGWVLFSLSLICESLLSLLLVTALQNLHISYNNIANGWHHDCHIWWLHHLSPMLHPCRRLTPHQKSDALCHWYREPVKTINGWLLSTKFLTSPLSMIR